MQNLAMHIGQRIKALMKARGISNKHVARYCGVTEGAVSNWFSSGRISKDNLVQVATVLGVPVEELITGETATVALTAPSGKVIAYGQPITVLADGEEPGDGYIQIKESSIRFAAGNGRVPVFEELTDSIAATYRIDWFQKNHMNPARCIRCKVHGDSMEPFLWDGETVLVNTAETNIINGKVYAMRYGDELRIKRVYRKLDGGLVLHSDNPEFLPRDEDVPASVAHEHIAIIGRVREKSGAGGL